MRKLTALTAVTILLLLVFSTVPAWARDPATPQMTLQQSYDAALAHSDDLKGKEAGSKKAWEQRDSAQTNLEFSPNANSGVQDPVAVAADSAYTRADLSYRTAQRDKEETKNQLKVDIYKAYTGVITAEENLRNDNQQLEKSLSDLKIARVKMDVGLISSPELTKAQSDYDSANTTVKADVESVNKAYVTFNNLVGLWPEDRPSLVDKIEYSPIKIDNIDTEVSRALDSNESIWKLKQNITLEKKDLDDLQKLYEAEKYDVDMAQVSVDSAEKALDASMRTTYNDIMALEVKYAALQSGLKTAEENLRVKKLLYDVGMATENDLLTAQGSVSSVQNQLLSVASQHENAKVAFYKATGREDVFPENK